MHITSVFNLDDRYKELLEETESRFPEIPQSNRKLPSDDVEDDLRYLEHMIDLYETRIKAMSPDDPVLSNHWNPKSPYD